MLTELKSFFENNPLAQGAAQSIRNGREIELIVTDGQQNFYYTFTKANNLNLIKDEKTSSPDLSFTIPKKSAQELLSNSFNNVGEVGLFIFEKMLSSDPEKKIKVKLHVGVLSLLAGGYLGVLTAGGSEVAKFLATKGLSSLGKLKEAISKLKSS